MGSPDAFRGRKRELEKQNLPSSDLDVVESYRKECEPSGEMGRYLRECDLAVRVGPVLFVHAALPKPPEVENDQSGVKALPFRSDAGNCRKNLNEQMISVEEWVEELNKFGKSQVRLLPSEKLEEEEREPGGRGEEEGEKALKRGSMRSTKCGSC